MAIGNDGEQEIIQKIAANASHSALSDEIREEVVRLIEERTPPQAVLNSSLTRSLTASNEALRTTNKALAAREESLTSRIEAEWKRPIEAFKYVVIFLGIVTAGGLYYQLLEGSRIYDLSSDLRDQVRFSEDSRKDVTLQLVNYDIQQTAVTNANAAALRTLALLGLAQDELYQADNPAQALVYLDEAATELEKSKEKASVKEVTFKIQQSFKRIFPDKAMQGDSLSRVQLSEGTRAVNGTLETLEFYIQVAKAECYVRRNDAIALLGMEQDLLSCNGVSPCEGDARKYYLGLIGTKRLVDAGEGSAIETYRQDALENFGLALGAKNSASFPVNIFRALLMFDAQQYGSAYDVADKYIHEIQAPTSREQDKLSARVHARLIIATAIRDLSGIAEAEFQQLPLENARKCSLSLNSLGRLEAECIRYFFERAVKQRVERTAGVGGIELANEFGLYCIGIITALDRSCLSTSKGLASAGCGAESTAGCGGSGGCGGDTNAPVVESYRVAMERSYGLWEPDEKIAISRDSELGVKSGGLLIMGYLHPVILEKTHTSSKCEMVAKTRMLELVIPTKEGEEETEERITVESPYNDIQIEDATTTYKTCKLETRIVVYEPSRAANIPALRYVDISSASIPADLDVNRLRAKSGESLRLVPETAPEAPVAPEAGVSPVEKSVLSNDSEGKI